MGIPNGRKSFKIGLAIQTQYRHLTDIQPSFDSKVHAYALRCMGKYLRCMGKNTAVIIRTDLCRNFRQRVALQLL